MKSETVSLDIPSRTYLTASNPSSPTMETTSTPSPPSSVDRRKTSSYSERYGTDLPHGDTTVPLYVRVPDWIERTFPREILSLVSSVCLLPPSAPDILRRASGECLW